MAGDQVAQLLLVISSRGGVAGRRRAAGRRRSSRPTAARSPGASGVAKRSSGGPTTSATAGGALQRDALGHQLAEHERQVGDQPGSAGRGEAVSATPGGQAQRDQRRREVRRQGRGAVRRGEEPGDGDADLDRGEEPVGVTGDGRDPGAAPALASPAGRPGSRAARPGRSRSRRTHRPRATKSSTRPRLSRVWVSNVAPGRGEAPGSQIVPECSLRAAARPPQKVCSGPGKSPERTSAA